MSDMSVSVHIHHIFKSSRNIYSVSIVLMMLLKMYSASKNLSNVLNILIVLWISKELLRLRICN